MVFFCHVAQPLAKHLGEGGFGRRGWFLQAFSRVELAGAVVGHRIGFGEFVAVALFGHHVQKLRALEAAQVLQGRNQAVEVVAVDGAHVVEPQFFKDGATRHHHAFGVFFKTACQLKQGRRITQHVFGGVACRCIKLTAHQPREVAVEATDRR